MISSRRGPSFGLLPPPQWCPRWLQHSISVDKRASGSSTRHTCIVAMDLTWVSTTIFIRRSLIDRRWSMERQVRRYSLASPRLQASMSSRSIGTAHSSRTDLDLILREWGITTVIISGTTTENCCHATARDAMFNNYKVVFLSDATGSFDYPDVGYGAMSAEEVHKATLCILAFSTAHVMTVDELKARVERGTTASHKGQKGRIISGRVRFSETDLALTSLPDRHSANVFSGGQQAHRQEQGELSELLKPATPGGARSHC